MAKVKIGIIGGSGMDDPQLMKDIRQKRVKTPYGSPSSPLTAGRIGGIDAVILARHGKDHSIYPTGVNYRANIHALKSRGVLAGALADAQFAGIRPQPLTGRLP